MSDKIRVRSPFFLRYSYLNAASVDLTIWIKAGSPPFTQSNYSLSKTTIGSNSYVVFEVAELLRDYITTTFDGNYDSTNNQPRLMKTEGVVKSAAGTTLITYTKDDYLVFDGYSYFEDGMNELISDTQYFLTDATKLRKPDGVSIAVAVNAEAVDTLGVSKASFWNNGSKVASTEITIDSTTNSNSKIDFVTSGTEDVDEVRVYKDVNNTNELLASIPVVTQDCSKYDATKLTFYNKYGVLQDLFFFSKSIKTLKVESEEFKASNLTLSTPTPSYDVNEHQYKTFDKQGKESIVLNTGLVGEEYNEPMRQLMLSENVWMTEGSTVYPMKIKTTNFREKTSLNDKVFNYAVELEYAFDKIQNVR
jgi:hypothetical protein